MQNGSCPVMPDWLQLHDEATYWTNQFHTLPCSRRGDAFEDCWPLIECVYQLYVGYPRATLQEALQLYTSSTAGLDRGLNQDEAATMFSKIWSRILKRAGGRALPDWLPGTLD